MRQAIKSGCSSNIPIIGIILTFFILLFGNNIYGQITGHSLFASPDPGSQPSAETKINQKTPTSIATSTSSVEPTIVFSPTVFFTPSNTLVPSFTPTPRPPTPDPRLFWDDFETGIKPEWFMEGYNYSTVNGQLSSNGWFTAYVGDASWNNYSVEFDLPYLIWSEYNFGILIRRQSDTDYMSFQITTLNQCAFRWSVVARGIEKIIVNSETRIDRRWEECQGHYKIEAIGNTYKTSKDGQLKLTFTDNTFENGNVGIVIFGEDRTNFILDNFKILLR